MVTGQILVCHQFKSSRKTGRHQPRNSQSPTTAGLESTRGSLLLCAPPPSSPLCLQCEGDEEEGRAQGRGWPQAYRGHADGGVRPAALHGAVQGIAEHAAQLHGVAVHGVNARPPVQSRLQGKGSAEPEPRLCRWLDPTLTALCH